VSRIPEIKIQNNILKPVTIYGCETWSTTEMEKVMFKKINIMMKMLSKQGIWKIRTHQGMWRKLYKTPALVVDTVRDRLEF
jgi:hypothetical protein